MPGEVRFWFQPTTDRIVLFFVTLFGIFLLLKLAKTLYSRSIERRQKKSLQEKLDQFQLTDRPEERVVRELAERYKVRPPDLLLSSLQQFDAVASDEILRIEREKMDLADRLDRIEFLYSIRMNAFSQEPSVGGLETILGPGYTGIHGAPEPDTETLIREDSVTEEEPSKDLAVQPTQEEEESYSLSEEEITSLKTLLGTDEDSDENEAEPREEG